MSEIRPDDKQPYTVHQSDARAIGGLFDTEIATKSPAIMATVTSPPYFNLLDYGTSNQIGFGQQYAEYLDDCQDVFQQIFDRTDEAGSLWLIADSLLDPSVSPSRLRNVPFDLADRCEAVGWTLRDVIIWKKDKTRPWSKPGRLRNSFEYVLYLVKSAEFKYRLDRIREPGALGTWWVQYPERYNPRGKSPENVWEYSIPSQGSWANTAIRHACPLPPDLVERILLLTTDEDDVVCDPFAGSGTVVAEAERLGRRGFGTELNPEYVAAYEEIVRQEIVFRNETTDRDRANLMSDELEVQINKLRAVKFAKSLWHQYRKSATDGDVIPSHVLAWATPSLGTKSRYQLQDVSLDFVMNGDTAEREAAQVRLKALSLLPPLTKYGIAGDIRVVDAADFMRTYAESELFVYEHGHTWMTTGLAEPATFLDMPPSTRRTAYPPIASNVEIRVAVPGRESPTTAEL